MNTIGRSFAWMSTCVLSLGLFGTGCDPSICYGYNIHAFDNRDRQFFPQIDKDWVCPDDIEAHPFPSPPPPPPPPPPPDVSGYYPADPPGPKDPDGVVKAAIMLNSCFGHLYFFWPKINWSINSMYQEMLRNRTTHALFQRTGCFKEKANGCDALRECVGIVQQVNGAPALDIAPDPELGEGCANGVLYDYAHFLDNWDVEYVTHTWFNCAGLGLECGTDFNEEWCKAPRTVCDPNVFDFGCRDGRPYGCEFLAKDGQYYSYEQPLCSDYGLTCNIMEGKGYPDCVGSGPACTDTTTWITDPAVFSYEEGVACESNTILRACLGKGEMQVDCATLGLGFTCIPGDKPHCGFASECDEWDPVKCEGDSLVICDAGRIRKVDCKSLGFTACDARHAVCSPGAFDNLP